MAYLSDRANHSLTVAKQMYEIALERSNDEFYAQKMFHLGLVHDIGYQFTNNNKEHAHVGGAFLREEGYAYWKEVYYHGDPSILELTQPSDEWFILNIADMQTDSKGNKVSFDVRLKDIGDRYGYDSQEYKMAKAMITKLQSEL